MRKISYLILTGLCMASVCFGYFGQPAEIAGGHYRPHEEYFYNEYYNHENVDLVYDEDIIKKVFGD